MGAIGDYFGAAADERIEAMWGRIRGVLNEHQEAIETARLNVARGSLHTPVSDALVALDGALREVFSDDR